MKALGKLLLVSFILLSISGCSGNSGTPLLIVDQDSMIAAKQGDSFIILGAKPSRGDIKSYLYSLELNGQSVGLQGVYKEGGKQFGSMHHHVQYVEGTKNSLHYLIWKIPSEMIQKPQPKALLYLAAVGDDNNAFYVFDFFVDLPVFSRPMAAKLYPFIGKTNPEGSTSNIPAFATEEPPVLDFQGCLIKIQHGTVYYLGEADVSGGIKKTGDSGYVTFGMSADITENQEMLRAVLAQKELNRYRLENRSNAWQKYPIRLYLSETREPLKD